MASKFHEFNRLDWVLLTIVALSGCGGGGGEPNDLSKGQQTVPLTALTLQQPKDCNDLKDYIVASIVSSNTTMALMPAVPQAE